jgi:hypothetical protein
MIFLKRNFPKTSLLPPKSGRANIFVLKPDDNFRRFVGQYSSPPENIKELERKLSFTGGFLVTFNDQDACRDEDLEFITIHHPIMKAIKRYYDKNKQRVASTSQFRLKGPENYQGNYLFFIYLLEKIALKKDLILIPILVNLDKGKVHIVDELCGWFLGEIVNAEQHIENLATYDDDQFEVTFKEAGEYLEMIREEEEQKLKKTNDILVNNQIESVKQAAIIKIKKAEETIEKLKSQGKTEDDPIIRLHIGRIRNLEISKEEKIKTLEQKRAASVGFNLIGGGVVKIE